MVIMVESVMLYLKENHYIYFLKNSFLSRRLKYDPVREKISSPDPTDTLVMILPSNKITFLQISFSEKVVYSSREYQYLYHSIEFEVCKK